MYIALEAQVGLQLYLIVPSKPDFEGQKQIFYNVHEAHSEFIEERTRYST